MEMEPDDQEDSQSWVKPLVTIDPTTGLLNAYGWLAFAKRHLKRAVYSQQRLGLVFLRVQNFARLKAELGPQAAEATMQQVADALQGLVRPGDLLGRWRDDDFIILLPYVDAGTIEQIAERLGQGIRRKALMVENHLFPLTVVTSGASLIVTRGELNELDTLLAEGERRLVAGAERR